MDENICPSCGGSLIERPDGTKECGITYRGHVYSCGWSEDPILDLAEPYTEGARP